MSGSSVFSPQFKNLEKDRIQLEKLLDSNNVWLFCDPLDYIPPDSSAHGISQARILEWVAISFSRGSYWTRDWTHISCIAGRFLTTELPNNHIQIQPCSSVPFWKQWGSPCSPPAGPHRELCTWELGRGPKIHTHYYPRKSLWQWRLLVKVNRMIKPEIQVTHH